MGEPVKVGLVGCGTIAKQYLRTIGEQPRLRLTAAADLDPARARAVADATPGVRALTVEELVADPEVDVVLNLTVPAAHAHVAHLAIAAGKDVYGEKPLAVTTTEAREVLDAAAAAGVRVACAPDTVLGTGVQTARAAIDSGAIGRPSAAVATMISAGPERWHPDPDFYYVAGGGPLMDMGPYYITALVTLLGPVTSVVGAAARARATRVIGSGPRAGQTIPVSVDTHVTGALTHESGAMSTLVMSFDAVATRAPNIEVHGDRGSLVVPDPNRFDGEVLLCELSGDGWRTLPVGGGYAQAGRGVGLADLAATPPDVEPRAGGRLAFHVLDVMEALLASARSGQAVAVSSTCERPRPVPYGQTP
ncbi:Gfo/Idh/MocA family protein [Thermostaphylospora chromogena]|uniref:Predicted dehydrogenase n=1 Tax=Thermostaphylospora chromogena TaxID=35622 RepID=A0A1H1HHI9_9ACTN|nr:Gfo/Idh/MocA family oxidoreductase [Thermostaphylospora chromogena]SDR24847.1 Predicted dehydrogenase [Thermostaphylospora chromogena]